MEWVWIAVLILAVVLEAVTAEMIAIWFFPGALISMILAFLKVSVWVQLPVFFAVSILLLLAVRPICRRFFKTKENKTNADDLIDKECLVTEEIDNRKEMGEVRINGLRWSARAEEIERVIPVGTVVTVVKINGVKLIVK